MITSSPGCDLAHEPRADDVERAGLRDENRRAVEVAEQQRPDAERVAAADQLLLGERDQREGAFDLAQRVDHPLDERSAVAGGDQMDDRLGVGGGLEDRAAALQLSLQRPGIGEVAVMRDGEAAAGELGEERLDVALHRAAGRGIAVVADGAVALQPLHDRGLGEIVADQADMALDAELPAVEGDDAGRLLAAMLQRMQAERSQRAASGWPKMPNTPHSSCSVSPSRSMEGDSSIRVPQSGGGASICRSSSFWSSVA